MSEASVKLLSRGVETLTDQELLELLLDDGDSERLAGALLSSFEGRLAALGYADIARLRMAAGIGLKTRRSDSGGCRIGPPGACCQGVGTRSDRFEQRCGPNIQTPADGDEARGVLVPVPQYGNRIVERAAGKPGRGAGDGGGSPVGHQTGPRTAGHADYPGSQPSFRCCLAQRAG